jgi:D-sedoheptulose 7-phosphate isomerase
MSSVTTNAELDLLAAHLQDSVTAIAGLHERLARVAAWAHVLYRKLGSGHRLLVAGNGGSAALAQHLTSELVGRFDGDRPAFSALCLSAESSSVSAIANDYGFEQVFARQVQAHGRAGDILLTLSTSGRSPNLLAAVAEASRRDLVTWAMTGALPNPLGVHVDDVMDITADSTAAVQDAQQVAVHLLCRAFDAAAHLDGTGPPR